MEGWNGGHEVKCQRYNGVLGHILLRLKWPVVNLVMGVVLGEILENSLGESLSIGNGNPLKFVTRPISLVLIILTVLIIAIPFYRSRPKRLNRV